MSASPTIQESIVVEASTNLLKAVKAGNLPEISIQLENGSQITTPIFLAGLKSKNKKLLDLLCENVSLQETIHDIITFLIHDGGSTVVLQKLFEKHDGSSISIYLYLETSVNQMKFNIFDMLVKRFTYDDVELLVKISTRLLEQGNFNGSYKVFILTRTRNPSNSIREAIELMNECDIVWLKDVDQEWTSNKVLCIFTKVSQLNEYKKYDKFIQYLSNYLTKY